MNAEMNPTSGSIDTSSSTATRKQPTTRASEQDLDTILHDQESKNYQDLRDRAAYVFVTGSFPTHLRPWMMSLLRMATRHAINKPVALDGRSGSQEITPEVRKALDLDSHPMVTRVRDFVGDGWKIFFDRELNERRPYTKTLLYKKDKGLVQKISVKSDGSILEGWDR